MLSVWVGLTVIYRCRNSVAQLGSPIEPCVLTPTSIVLDLSYHQEAPWEQVISEMQPRFPQTLWLQMEQLHSP